LETPPPLHKEADDEPMLVPEPRPARKPDEKGLAAAAAPAVAGVDVAFAAAGAVAEAGAVTGFALTGVAAGSAAEGCAAFAGVAVLAIAALENKADTEAVSGPDGAATAGLPPPEAEEAIAGSIAASSITRESGWVGPAVVLQNF
jgi:hypothetical protein